MSFILHTGSWGWDWRFSTVWSKPARSHRCWLSPLSVDYAVTLYPFIVVPLSLTVSGLRSPKPLHISEMWGEICSGLRGKEKRLFPLSFSTRTTNSPDSAGSRLVAVRMTTLRAVSTQSRGEKDKNWSCPALNFLPLGRKWQWCLLLPSLAPKVTHAISLPSLLSCCLVECRGSSGRPCRGLPAGFHNPWATDLLGTGLYSKRWAASRQETKALSVFTAAPLRLLHCLSSSCQISGSTGVSQECKPYCELHMQEI